MIDFLMSMDLIAINVYWLKGVYVTSGLYIVFLVLATLGGIAWLQSYRRKACLA